MFEKYFWKCVWYGNDSDKCSQIRQLLNEKRIKAACYTVNLANTFHRTRALKNGDDILKEMYRYEISVSKKDYEKAMALIRSR